jgi:tetratricopeptide (TPR) repeat protein
MPRALLVPVVTLLLASASGPPAGAQEAAPDSGARALVMPLTPGNDDPRGLWLGEGVALLIADALTALGQPTLSRGARLSAFETLDLPLGEQLSRATLVRAAQLVGVRTLVLGSLLVDGDHLEVRVRDIDVEDGRSSPDVVERGSLVAMVALAERAARRLRDLPVDGAEDPVVEPPPSLEAFEAYVKGLVAETPATQVRFLSEAVRQAPGYGRAHLALWDVHTEQREHARALEAALAVPPTARSARRARFAAGLSLMALGRLDEAFDTFGALAEAAPSAAVFNNLGVVQLRRGETPPSGGTPAWYFTRAAELAPDTADYYFNLGYAYWTAQDMPAAIYWLREVVRRRPGDGDAHYVLSAALEATGSASEAARERELASQLSSRYATWDHQGAAGAASRRVPPGLERPIDSLDGVPLRFDSALVTATRQEHQQLARFHYDRGVRLAEQEQDFEAITEFRKSLYLSPYAPETHLALGRVLVRGGRLRDAIEALKISLWSAESVEGRLLLAEALIGVGDYEAAVPHAERALRLTPGESRAAALLEKARAEASAGPPAPP